MSNAFASAGGGKNIITIPFSRSVRTGNSTYGGGSSLDYNYFSSSDSYTNVKTAKLTISSAYRASISYSKNGSTWSSWGNGQTIDVNGTLYVSMSGSANWNANATGYISETIELKTK